jgi:hypothetical protein
MEFNIMPKQALLSWNQAVASAETMHKHGSKGETYYPSNMQCNYHAQDVCTAGL